MSPNRGLGESSLLLFEFVLLVKQRFEMGQINGGIWNAHLCARFLPSKVTRKKAQGVYGGRGGDESRTTSVMS